MLEIQSEAHIRRIWDQSSHFLFTQDRISLALGRIVTEIITGGTDDIMQQADRLEKALAVSGGCRQVWTSYFPLCFVCPCCIPLSRKNQMSFSICFPSFHIFHSHATYNLLFFTSPDTIIFPSLFPSSE